MDDFRRLFCPSAFKTMWAELSINQSAFKHVGDKKIELEEIDEAGNTAFHLAASKDFLPIFDIRPFIGLVGLNKRESNPKNKEGRTPLHIAAEKGHRKFCQLVLQGTQWQASLSFRQMINNHGHTFEPNYLNRLMEQNELEIKLDNPADNVGMTPLHLAAKSGHLSICKVHMHL